ncbi:hypothetical protein BVRB_4g076320 [Beta vulgaris subsp. vulgaris]|uniref:Uncharacterized protein n=1 Tax=Beta vulgaris subsp. vulgaris TaxID=3555 RepID=A0A0J8FEM1_BETVV|nr:hypothetical protein BVRB_4g076320 [Beta vulgaris subsp. vulgaris]
MVNHEGVKCTCGRSVDRCSWLDLVFSGFKNRRCVRELTMISFVFRLTMTFIVFAVKNFNLQAALQFHLPYFSKLERNSSSDHEPRIQSVRSSLELLMRRDAILAFGCSLSDL